MALSAGLVGACSGDAGGGTAPAGNRAPTFSSSPVTQTDHNRPYSYVVATQDPDGDTVALSLRQAPSWLTLDTAAGELSGLPDWGNIRSHSVVVQAHDGVDSTFQGFSVEVVLGEIVCDQDFGGSQTSLYNLPFKAGATYRLIQTYCPPNPAWGHHDWFAYDFDTAIGDTVVATRGGTVLFVRENFTDGNRQPGNENFVFVRHPDGTVMHYMHLTRNGALVNVGDAVIQGQPIGLSGDTGNSSGPHIHIALFRSANNFDRQSTLPINFRNAQGPLDGNRGLVQGANYTAGP
jgi:murein DD-endopeptidase MepM/ murein hydrolase activator NlpD